MSGVDISAECCQKGAVSVVLVQLEFFVSFRRKFAKERKVCGKGKYQAS